jgi:hypothetical protein
LNKMNWGNQAHVLRLEATCSSTIDVVPPWWDRWSQPSTFATSWVMIIDSSYLAPHLLIAGVVSFPFHFCSKREKKRKNYNQSTFLVFKLLSLLTFLIYLAIHLIKFFLNHNFFIIWVISKRNLNITYNFTYLN